MNFSSKANYKKWLGYVHATGLAESTPGHQPVSIKGKKHKVKHATGGLTASQINLTKALESLFGGKDVFPQKFPDGGPILPITPVSSESTSTNIKIPLGNYSKPNEGGLLNIIDSIGETIGNDLLGIKVDSQDMQKHANAMKMIETDVPSLPEGFNNEDRKAYNRLKLGLDPAKITPRYSKFRYRERAYGGITANGTYKNEAVKNIESMQNGLNTFGDVVSMVPGIGTILGSGIKLFGNMNANKRLKDLNNVNNIKSSENIYGNFANGGFVNSNFKQYNAGSHASGMDQGVDAMGNPNNNAEGGYVQNQENAYKFDNTAYVMSDTLINPQTGNYFNQDAAKLNSKYKKADYIPEERNALEFGMSRLSKLNDGMKNLKEQVLKACGGSTKKHADGGPIDPRFNYLINTETSPLETFNENLPYSFNILSESIPTYSVLDQGIATDTTNPMGTSSEINIGTNLSEPRGGSKKMPLTFPKIKPNDIALALKGAGLIGTIAAAAKPATKEAPILPDYTKSDLQMYLANVDYTQAMQDALGAANLASNVNRSAAQNFGQYQGRQSMNYANLADQLANIQMQESNQRSQLALTRSQYETNKSVDTANRLYQNRIDNMMNQATADLADEKLFSELTQIGTTFNEYQYYKDALKNNKEIATAKIKEAAAILGNKYENFGFSEDFIEKLKNEDYDNLDFEQAIKFMATADQIKKAKKK